MRTRYSVDQATVRRRPRQSLVAGARRRVSGAMAMAMAFLPLLALLVTVEPVSAETTGFFNTTTGSPKCPAGKYTVPSGTRYIQITANGGAGSAGITDTINPYSTGGRGGTGARVTAIFPVTPGQQLYVVVGRAGANGRVDYSGWPDGGQNGYDWGQGGGSSFVTTQELVAFTGCKDGTKDPIDPNKVMRLDRSQILILAGGGGGGGGGGTFGSGGNGGNAGAQADFGGEPGSDAYHDSAADCNYGRAGGGASQSGPGTYGSGGCLSSDNGTAGNGFYGGDAGFGAVSPVAAQGAGGGGWYGGGSGGPSSGSHGGGGGGAGSSYVRSDARTSLVRQAVDDPQVVIDSLEPPTTAASTGTGTPLVDWYTSVPTISLRAQAGTFDVAKTYYAIDKPACSATNLSACTVYSAPFSVGSGIHTLTYFSVDAKGLDEVAHTRSFAVTPTTSAGVTAASIGSGTNPSATAGGAAGSISVSAAGSGVVGAAVYGANPAGAPVFNSSGAYVDVIAGSGLTSLTIKDCNLNGGTNVYWWNGTAWALTSNQVYDPATKCVTVTVSDTTIPTLSQLTGTVIAAGSPPSTTPVATTADGKPYTAGTWTNQSVTVAFTCSANATPSAPVTLGKDAQNQSASGTCTDGLGQQTTTTFGGINVDKTPPSCAILVSPTVLWPANGKPVAVAGTVTARDNLSGIARVLGGAITSNETLVSGDVQGFAVNATYASPLKLSAVLNLAGTLVAKRAGGGDGRIYSQLVTVTDQAGNSSTCTWTVTVPHDQRGRD